MLQNPHHEYTLLSDVTVPQALVPSGAHNVVLGRRVSGGLGIVPYHAWMKRVAEGLGGDLFYEVDHYLPFPLRGIATATTIHDLYVLEGIEHYPLSHRVPYKMLVGASLRNADVVSAVSNFTVSRIRKFFGNGARVVHLPIGVEAARVVPDDVKTPRFAQPFVLVLGRISYWKSSLEIARFYEEYLAKAGLDLVYVGRCDARERRVLEEIQHVAERCSGIHILDYVSDEEREGLLQSCAVLLYCSKYDGFGLPPLEAAIRRVPTVVSDIPVLHEVLRNQGTYIDLFGDPRGAARVVIDVARAGVDERVLDRLEQLAREYTYSGYFEKLLE